MSENIVELMRACLTTPKSKDSEDVKVDSLMDFSGCVDIEKTNAIFEIVVNHVKRLPKQFLDPEGGWTFLNLPFFDDGFGGPGKQWGEQVDAGLLVIVCAYFGIIQDPLHTLDFKEKCLSDLPGGVSYFGFNVEPLFLDAVRHAKGIT